LVKGASSLPELEDLHQRILSCTDCTLHKNRTRAVPGEGSAHAPIMFVGEGPGFQEDRQGRPFVGPAGQFLNELLASVNLRREDVFITNMVKCRPPNNRDPFPGEIAACNKYLEQQIQAINPQLIVPLGRYALANWFQNESIGKVRAKPRSVGGMTIFPLYHPAAALHNPALRETIERDFQAMGRMLQAPPPVAAESVSETAKEGPSEGKQLSLL
jgi:uracil-DNA glycosylase family 4